MENRFTETLSETKTRQLTEATQRKQAEVDPIATATAAANSMTRGEFLSSDNGIPAYERDSFYAANNLKNTLAAPVQDTTPVPEPSFIDNLYNPDSTPELSDTDTVGGLLSNAAKGFGSAAHRGLVGIVGLGSEAEAFYDVSGEDIDAERDNPIYASVADGMEQIKGLQLGNKDGSNDAAISDIFNGFTQEQAEFVSPRKEYDTSKYEVFVEKFKDDDRSAAISEHGKIFDKFVNNDKMEIASEQLGKSYDDTKATLLEAKAAFDKGDSVEASLKAAGAIANITGDTIVNVVENPEAALQLLAESAPEMLAIAKTVVGGLGVAFARTFTGNIQDLRKENEGKLLTNKQKGIAVASSGAEAVVGVVGDKIGIAGGKIKGAFTKKVKVDPLKAAAAKSKKALADKGKNRLVQAAGFAAGKVGNNLKAGAQEFVEEATESVLGDLAVKQDISKIDVKEAFVSGALGFGAGQALNTKVPQLAVKAVTSTPAALAAIAKSISTVGKNRPTKPETKVEEAAETVFNKPEDYDAPLDAIESELDELDEELGALNATGSSLSDDIPSEKNRKEELKAKEVLVADKIATKQEEMASLIDAQENFKTTEPKVAEEVKKDQEVLASKSTPERDKKALRQEGVDFVADNANDMDPEDINDMANSGNYDAKDTAYLRSAYDLSTRFAHVAGSTGKTIGAVASEIKDDKEGTGDKLSIKDYMTQIPKALQEGKSDTVSSLKTKLDKFTDHMKKKAELLNAYSTAFANVDGSTKFKDMTFNAEQTSAIQNAEGIFSFTEEKYANASVNSLNSFTRQVTMESELLKDTQTSMRNLIATNNTSRNNVRKTVKQNKSDEARLSSQGIKSTYTSLRGDLNSTLGFAETRAISAAVFGIVNSAGSSSRTVDTSNLAERSILSALITHKTNTNDQQSFTPEQLKSFNDVFAAVAKEAGNDYTPVTMESISTEKHSTVASLKKLRRSKGKLDKAKYTNNTKKTKESKEPEPTNDKQTLDSATDKLINKRVKFKDLTKEERSSVIKSTGKNTEAEILKALSPEDHVLFDTKELLKALSENNRKMVTRLFDGFKDLPITKLLNSSKDEELAKRLFSDDKGNASNSPAAYDPMTHTIYFNDRVKRKEGFQEWMKSDFGKMTLVHELIHAAVLDVMAKPNDYSDEQRDAVIDLNTLFAELKDTYENLSEEEKSKIIGYENAQLNYAFTNVDEFVAVALSNPSAMLWLSEQMPVQVATERNWVNELYSSLLKMMGIEQDDNLNALSQLTTLINELTDSNEGDNEFLTPPVEDDFLTEDDDFLDEPNDDDIEEEVQEEEEEDTTLEEERNHVEAAPDTDIDQTVKTNTQGLLHGVISPLSDKELGETEGLTLAQQRLKFRQDVSENGGLLHRMATAFRHANHSFAALASRYTVKILGKSKLGKEQQESLNSFANEVTELSSIINEVLVPKASKAAIPDEFKQVISLLRDGNDKLHTGVADTIAAAAIAYMATSSDSVLNPSIESMSKFLNLEQNSNELFMLLGYFKGKGMPKGYVAAEMGRAILGSLNLTTRDNAPMDLNDQLASSLGDIAIRAMQSRSAIQGNTVTPMLVQSSISYEGMKDYLDKEGVEIKGALETVIEGFEHPVPTVHPSFIPNDNKWRSLIPSDFVREMNTNTLGILPLLDSVLGGISNVESVRFVKPERGEIKKTMRRTNRQVSRQQVDALLAMAQRPQTAKTELIDLINLLSEDNANILEGLHTDEEIDNAFINERETMLGRNKKILNNREDSINFKAQLANEPEGIFYFMHNVWKQGRMGMQARGINPQQSHMDRHRFQSKYLNDITLDVKTGDIEPGSKQEAAYLAIAMALDVKIENQSPDKSVKFVQEQLARPEVIAVLDNLNNNSMSDIANQDALMELVTSYGSEYIYALDGLATLAKLKDALDSGGKEIPFQLFIEVDGKTNGPALSKIMLGADYSEVSTKKSLRKIGASFEGDGTTTFAEIKESGNAKTDYYEDYAKHYLEGMLNSFDSQLKEVRLGKLTQKEKDLTISEINAFRKGFIGLSGDYITTNYDGTYSVNTGAIRSFGKIGLIPANYGSGSTAQAKILINTLTENASARITELGKLIRSGDIDVVANAQEELAVLIDNLAGVGANWHYGEGKSNLSGQRIRDHKNIANIFRPEALPNKTGFNLNTFIALKPGNTPLMEAAKSGADIALDRQQGTVIKNRTLISIQARFMVNAYNVSKKVLLTEAGNKNGPITVSEVKAIDAKLSEMYPAFHSVFSQINDNIDQGFVVHKTENVTNEKVRVTTDMLSFEGHDTEGKSIEGKSTGSTRRTQTSVLSSGGVAPHIANIIGMDSTIMTIVQNMLGERAGLNIHDAFTLSLDGVTEDDAAAINKVAYLLTKDFNILEMTQERLNQSIKGYREHSGTLGKSSLHQEFTAGNVTKNMYDNIKNLVEMHYGEEAITVMREAKFMVGEDLTEDPDVAIGMLRQMSDVLEIENRLNKEANGIDQATAFDQYSSVYGGYDVNGDAEYQKRLDTIIGTRFKKEKHDKGTPDSEGYITVNLNTMLWRQGLSESTKTKHADKLAKAESDYTTRELTKILNRSNKRPLRQEPLTQEELESITKYDEINKWGSTSNPASRAENYSHFDDITDETVVEIFDSMPDEDVTPASVSHSKHLRGVITRLVQGAIQPMTLLMGTIADKNHGYVNSTKDTFYMAMQKVDDTLPRSKLIGLMAMSKQEILAHELTSTVIEDGLANDPSLRNEVVKVYDHLKGQINVEDIMPDHNYTVGSDEYIQLHAHYQEVFDTVFSPSKGVKRISVVNPITGKRYKKTVSTNLSALLTLTVTNENFANAVKDATDMVINAKPKGLVGHIYSLFSKLLNGTYNLLTGAGKIPDSINTYNRTLTLTKGLSNIVEANKKAKASADSKYLDVAQDGIDKAHSVAAKLGRGIGSTLQNSNKESVVYLGQLINPDEKLSVHDLFETINNWRHDSSSGKEGIFGNLLSEIVGSNTKNLNLIDVFTRLKTSQDKERIQIASTVSDFSRGSYGNSLNAGQDKALKDILLNTDIAYLLKGMDPGSKRTKRLNALLTNNNLVESEIQKNIHDLRVLSSDSGVDGLSHFYERMSESLGSIMVHGEPTEALIINNAYNIARVNYNGSTVDIGESDAKKAQHLIDNLASLYALQKTNRIQRSLVSDLANTNMDAVMTSVELAETFKREAFKTNFQGQESLLQKGYSLDVTNPHIGLKVASIEEEEYLTSLGYVRGGRIIKDPADNSVDALYLYKNPHSGKSPIVSGMLTLNNQKSAGTSTLDLAINSNSIAPQAAANLMVKRVHKSKAREAAKLFSKRKHTTRRIKGVLSGVYDGQGNVVDYRYRMSEQTKEALLERDESFHKVIGQMYAAINTKKAAKEGNVEAINTLYDSYKVNNKDKPGRDDPHYLTIGPDSKDKELQRMWHSLPEESKIQATNLFGSEGMRVPRDSLNLTLGYTLPSIIDLWTMNPKEKKIHHKVITSLLDNVLGSNAPKHAKKLEDVFIWMASQAKTNLLVRGLLVTSFNYLSNVTTLAIAGVPLKNIATGHIVAFKEAKAYQDNAKALYRFKLEHKMGDRTRRVVDGINTYQSRLDNSSIKHMVDAGALQTIVEDLNPEDTGFKKKFERDAGNLADKVFDKVPDSVKGVASEFFMAEGSTSYEMSSNILHTSDFAARYVLFNHMKKVRNPKSDTDIFRDVMTMFVPYDLPTNKYVQYGNNIGLLWYTRFILRNGKAIMLLARDHPDRTIIYAILNAVGVPLESILETPITPAAIVNRVGLPITEFLDSIGNIASINGLTSITN